MKTKIGITATEFPHLSLEEIFSRAKKYGAECIELVQGKNIMNREDARRAREFSERYGIQIASINNYFADLSVKEGKNQEAQKLFKESIEIAEELKTKFIVTYCFSKSFENFSIYLENLHPYLEACEKKRIFLALENEPGGITRTAEGILKVVETVNSPYFQINYDPDNFYNGGEEGFPYAYEMIKEHIIYVHAKDSVKFKEGLYSSKEKVLHRAIDAMCVPLGEGALNWEGITRKLREDRYNGFIIIEPHTNLEKLDMTFQRGIQYLKQKGL